MESKVRSGNLTIHTLSIIIYTLNKGGKMETAIFYALLICFLGMLWRSFFFFSRHNFVEAFISFVIAIVIMVFCAAIIYSQDEE